MSGTCGAGSEAGQAVGARPAQRSPPPTTTTPPAAATASVNADRLRALQEESLFFSKENSAL